MIQVGKACHVGIQRQGNPNQDAVAVIQPGLFSRRPPLLVVADGLGGYQGGQVASSLVVAALEQVYRASNADPDLLLNTGIRQAHQQIIQAASRDAELAKMGSTVAAVIPEENHLHLANVGDSRVYLVSPRAIRQVSWDHSVVGDLVRKNLITPEQARFHPQRNQLTMSLSAQRPTCEIYQKDIDTSPEEVILLCSDGLWGVVPEDQIQEVILALAPQPAADRLVWLANANRGPDNISVIIARQKRSWLPF